MEGMPEMRSVLKGVSRQPWLSSRSSLEEELLTLIGSESLSPIEYTSAVVYSYAPEYAAGLEGHRASRPRAGGSRGSRSAESRARHGGLG